MNVSTAVNMFIKAVLREQKIPFEVRANSFDENIYQKLKEAEHSLCISWSFYLLQKERWMILSIIFLIL